MSDYFDRIERQLIERVRAPSRRSRLAGLASGRLIPTGAVLVAVAVVAVFVGLGTRRSAHPATGMSRSPGVLTYVARSAGRPLQTASLRMAVARLRARLAAVSPAVAVTRNGDLITIRGVAPATRSTVQALTRPGRLEFYWWEVNALTPDGRTVASRLGGENPTAVTISQGALGAGGPGAGGGGLSLYRAVGLASRQPAVPAVAAAGLSRLGPLYYLFGSSGSAGCATVARIAGTVAARGQHCLLAGPAASPEALRSDLPAGVSSSGAQQMVVPQGTVVLQAAVPPTGRSPAPGSSATRFYVLRDNPSLSAAAITHPRQSTDASGNPEVSLGFTGAGAKQFQQVTAAIAHAGAASSGVGAANQRNQHFAIALDGRLLSVPSIDFKTYPDGVTGGGGADIVAGFTRQSAQQLCILLRSGPLPVDLVPAGHA